MEESPAVPATTSARAAIIEAARQLLNQQGAGALTTRAVAQLAGVQAPTIYRLFGDKNGLVDAVAEQVMSAYVADKSAASSTDGDPVAELRTSWLAHVQFGLGNAELYGLLNAPGRAERSPATAAGIAVLRARVHRIAAAGLLRVDEDRAVDIVHAAGAGTTLALLSTRPQHRDLGLAEAMFEVIASAVLNRAPATPDTGVRTVTVTFMTVLGALPALTDAERTLMSEWLSRSLAELRQTAVAMPVPPDAGSSGGESPDTSVHR